MTLGRYDPEKTRSRLADCPGDCVPPQIETYAGRSYYRWDPDAYAATLSIPETPPLFLSELRLERLLVRREALYQVRGRQDMHDVIDTIRDEQPSMLGDEDFALAARALGSLDVNAAVLTDACFAVPVGEQSSRQEVVVEATETESDCAGAESTSSEPALRRFEVAASGPGYDTERKRTYIALALLHDDPADAEMNLERLVTIVEEGVRAVRRHDDGLEETLYWHDLVDEIEVGAAGRLVVARLYGPEVLTVGAQHPTKGFQPLLRYR